MVLEETIDNHATPRDTKARLSRIDATMCYIKRRLPILRWLPKYKRIWFLQDALAGITVGLTAIPQGIAYAVLAGLSPEYGLYSTIAASFVYILFGSNKVIVIGPTAIMATMVQPIVASYGPDTAVLLTFFKGCIVTLIGILHLGFLLDFISFPVITGFTVAAIINIATSQFNPFLGISGKSGSLWHFLHTFFGNLNKIRYQDTILGFCTVLILVSLKIYPGKRDGTWIQKIAWFTTLARNAIAVTAGALTAYIFHQYGLDPFRLTASLGQGLPTFSLPPFSTTFKNHTYDFQDMIKAMGTSLISIPMVSMIEHTAIFKAFAGGSCLDTTQEMLALGLCNIGGSFIHSMPITGSLTRSAINRASGVQTPLGGLYTGVMLLLTSALLGSTLRFIPKATLAGIIMMAMYNMFDLKALILLWQAKKSDFLIMFLTLSFGVFVSLEIGVIIGVVTNLIFVLYFVARPSIETRIDQTEEQSVLYVLPEEGIAFPAAEYLRSRITKMFEDKTAHNVILDLKNLKRIDTTVAENIKIMADDLSSKEHEMICINSAPNINATLNLVAPNISDTFKADRIM